MPKRVGRDSRLRTAEKRERSRKREQSQRDVISQQERLDAVARLLTVLAELLTEEPRELSRVDRVTDQLIKAVKQQERSKRR